jgi:hypothetical protein
MLKYLLSALLLCLNVYALQEEPDKQKQYPINDEQVIWTGPGYYYGIYFYNEGEYNDWYNQHYAPGEEDKGTVRGFGEHYLDGQHPEEEAVQERAQRGGKGQ